MLAKVWSNLERTFRPTLLSVTMWWQAAFPISVSPSMAADDYNPVSLRHKSKKKSRGANGAMSRRRVSVKELGQPDHQGWLYKKKESKGFLGMKWKKFWFVLKKTALYWYTNAQAEKAEGYIDLTNFMIDRAIECKKKHAFKACHPQVMMFYFAAENHEEMNVWLNKLGLASIHYEPTERNPEAECYSEASDHEEAETTDIPPPPYCEQTLRDSLAPSGSPGSTHQGTLPPPYSSAVPSEANCSHSSPLSTMTSQSSSASSLSKQRQSWLDLVAQVSTAPIGEVPAVRSVQVHLHEPPPEEEEAPEWWAPLELAGTGSSEEGAAKEETSGDHCNSTDEMEKLYIHLKEASLSPIGDRKPSTKREFRASFVKRCKNHSVNEKLHLIRTLNSTLKSKQADLQALEQVLSDPELTSVRFREWKESNGPLVQEICVLNDQQVEAEAFQDGASVIATPVAETSL
ncbi:interactor protein for cytohesin exchange factors 1 isoform X1 [Hippocampus zosterae]|uniref:interactor protein for cytohesin exchange factors 1 isoform X1 n=2 Tax=Hippocampus zosterae TaxID=109293 RepID=UPI00223D9D07|nr:interactor protein for cytohesin exchange factors 1 isoform X1 [Hippocampus zosterae]